MNFEWVGNHLALDFLNTVNWGEPEDPGERLGDYHALTGWAEEAGLVTVPTVRKLRARAAGTPAAGSRAVNRAQRIRSALYGIFGAMARGESPKPEEVEAFNRFLADVRLRVEPGAEADFAWAWPLCAKTDRLDGFLHPVVWAGAQLLMDEDLRGRVKSCANDLCGWLFVDESRRGNRRWCDMRDCGNREKARRFYKRHRSAT